MNNRSRRILAVTLAMAILVSTVPVATFAETSTAAIEPLAFTTATLQCVTFVDENTGFAAGTSGIIAKTSNGGLTWRVVRNGTESITGIAFFDAMNGIAVTSARKVLGTSDGGLTWTVRNVDMTYYAAGQPQIRVNGLAAVPGSSTRAYLIGGDPNTADEEWYGEQVWTTDVLSQPGLPGVAWWQRYEAKPHLWVPEYGEPTPVGHGEFFGIDFVDASRGWAVGRDYGFGSTPATAAIASTTDGGFTWVTRSLGATATLTAVSFATTTTGVVVSAQGRIFRTADGGVSWQERPSPVTSALAGVAMIDATRGWAVGAGGVLLQTTDGGVSWTRVTSPTSADLKAVTFVGTKGWAVGSGGVILQTTDGVTWSRYVLDTTPPSITSVTSSTHPDPGMWYPVNAPQLSWVATDASGIDGCSYAFDQWPYTDPDTTIDTTATSLVSPAQPDGVWYFHIRAIDAAGNWSGTVHLPLRIDTTPPTTTSDVQPVYASGALITLTATDAHAGVERTEYVLDGGPVQLGTSVLVSSEGEHTLAFASVDRAGNREGTSTVSFRIDASGPQITSLASATHPDPSAWYVDRFPRVSWAATDPAGVTGYALVVDQQSTTELASSVTTTATSIELGPLGDGVHYVHLRACDGVGNWSGTVHLPLRIDTTPPTTTATVTVGYLEATVTLSPGDAHAGVATTVWDVEGLGAGEGTVVRLRGIGTHTVAFASTDRAGNREATRTIDVIIPRPPVTYVPLAGSDRFQTALTVSRSAFANGACDTVIIATGRNWPDALGGTALAGVHAGPVLLVDTRTIPAGVIDEIRRLGASRAIILGGTGAVGPEVETALKGVVTPAGRLMVDRLDGSNRYETANRIARAVTEAQGTSYDGTAFVATGGNFPDALAAAPLAAARGWPLFLADPVHGLSASTKAAMTGVKRVIILGGTGAVSAATEAYLKSRFGSGNVTRLQGADRYATAVTVATYGVRSAGLRWDGVGITTGQNFPDALAGGVLQGRSGSVMLLTPSTSLAAVTESALATNRDAILNVRYFGGVGALSSTVRDRVARVLD